MKKSIVKRIKEALFIHPSERKGNDLKIVHLRRPNHQTNTENPKGGMTIIINLRTWNVGVSICSDNENYDKYTGRNVALERMRQCDTLLNRDEFSVGICLPPFHEARDLEILESEVCTIVRRYHDEEKGFEAWSYKQFFHHIPKERYAELCRPKPQKKQSEKPPVVKK